MKDSNMVKFTSKVRRGLRQMLERKLAEQVELTISYGTAPGLPRDKRLTAAECEELRAAVAWIRQEVAALDTAEDTAVDLGRDVAEPGTAALADAIRQHGT